LHLSRLWTSGFDPKSRKSGFLYFFTMMMHGWLAWRMGVISFCILFGYQPCFVPWCFLRWHFDSIWRYDVNVVTTI
jgi:hypothetical protein